MKPFLIADLFCGAGGSSTGAVRAVKSLGREMILVCVNHWPLAIETHQANHPYARHYIEDITVADPVKLVPEGYLDLLMASPECTHFSRARGGKPVNNQSRMNPWAILTWLTKLDVRTVLIENVPEFRDWGPVDANDQPIKEMKGIFFEAWLEAIRRCGYKLEYRILNAADYGDATTRRRFFLIARKDGRKVTFPSPTHSRTGGDGLIRWRPAREIIDWNNPGRSLLDHPKYKKYPLAFNTRRRIAAGFMKQGGALAPYFIRLLDLDGGEGGSGWPEGFTFNNRLHSTARGMEQPIHTVTGSWNGGNILVQPRVEPFVMANRTNNVPRSMDEPIHTATAENMGNLDLIEPKVEPVILGQQSCSAARTPEAPIPTVATAGKISLTSPAMVVYHGNSNTRPVNEPLPCQPTKSKLGLVQPQIVKYYGTKQNTNSVEAPLDTVTTKERFGLVESVIVKTDQTGSNGNCVRPVSDPVATLVTKANTALAEAIIFPVGHGKKDLKKQRTLDINVPLPAMTTHRHTGIVQPAAEPVREPDIDPRRLVWIDGVLYKLDILFRMLTNTELARSHSFDDSEHRYEFKGTVAEVTKQIGNSVPCGVAAALVGEILK